MINVDIHTKIIPDTIRVFVARPGGKYRFFSKFVEENFVGPELPSLDLPHFDKLDDVDDLAERVMRSVAIRRWETSGRNDILLPDRNIENYKRRAADRATSQFLRVTRVFFKELRQGDLVIVPPVNFKGMAQIGEMTTPPNVTRELIVERYPDDPLVGRHVRWLASMPKSDLPPQTLDALQKPSAIFLLSRPFWPAIFRRAYGSYSAHGEYGARFEITSEKFKTTDDFYIQAFFNFVVANTDLVSKNSEQLLSFKDAAFSNLEGIAPDLFTNVNSPGGLSLKSLVITPIVIAAMLALAVTVGPEAVNAANSGQIVFGNSLAPDADQCAALVSEQVVTQLKLLGYDRWAEACSYAREAAERTGVNSNVDVTGQ